MPLDPVLARIPGLAGFLAQDDVSRSREAQGLENATRTEALSRRLVEADLQRKSRSELEAMGQNPSEDALIQWGAKYSPPKDVLHWKQQAKDRAVHEQNTKEATLARLQQVGSQFNMNMDFKIQSAKSKQEQDYWRNLKSAKQLQLQAEAQRLTGRKLFFETGDEGALQTPNVSLPTPPGGGLAEGAVGAPQVPADQVTRQTAPTEQAGMALFGGGQPRTVEVQPPAPAAPTLPLQDRFMHQDMPPEVRSQPPASRKKWIDDYTGQKAQNTFATDTAMLRDVNAAYDRLKKQTDLVLGAKLGRVTGIPGWLPNIPGQAGSVADSRLKGLKDQVMIDTMRSLKAISTTGATGFGSLTEQEGARLEGYLGNLSRSTSEEEIRRVVRDIGDFAEAAKKRLHEAYVMKHKSRIGTPGVRQQATDDATVQEALQIINRGKPGG